jgi:hypothetical protein
VAVADHPAVAHQRRGLVEQGLGEQRGECLEARREERAVAGVLAALLAPSILLGLERANNDLVMVALISFAAVLSGFKSRLSVLGVILLLATCAWLMP